LRHLRAPIGGGGDPLPSPAPLLLRPKPRPRSTPPGLPSHRPMLMAASSSFPRRSGLTTLATRTAAAAGPLCCAVSHAASPRYASPLYATLKGAATTGPTTLSSTPLRHCKVAGASDRSLGRCKGRRKVAPPLKHNYPSLVPAAGMPPMGSGPWADITAHSPHWGWHNRLQSWHYRSLPAADTTAAPAAHIWKLAPSNDGALVTHAPELRQTLRYWSQLSERRTSTGWHHRPVPSLA